MGRLVASSIIPDTGVAVTHHLSDGRRDLGQFFRIPGIDLAPGAGPGGAVGDGQHLAGVGADVGEVSVEDVLVDQSGRPRLASDHRLLGMVLVTEVGVAVVVKAQMGSGNHLEGRHFRRQVFQVIEDPHQAGTTQIVPENPGAPGLAVAVQADPGVTRLGPVVAVAHHDDLVAEKRLQEGDGRRVGDQLGNGAAPELDAGPAALVNAVVPGYGLHPGGLGLQALDVLAVQEVGQDDVTFNLQMPDALPQRQGRPVGIHNLVFLRCHGYPPVWIDATPPGPSLQAGGGPMLAKPARLGQEAPGRTFP